MGWPDLGLGCTAVPVLCYHGLGRGGVSPELFAAQMRLLKEKSVRCLRLAELRQYLAGTLVLDCPAVCITFDDGFRDVFTLAAPVLRELKLSCVVFMIASRLRPVHEAGREGGIDSDQAHEAFGLSDYRGSWLSAEEIRIMVEQGVAEIGSHGLRHLKLPMSGPELIEIPEHWSYGPWRKPGSGPAPHLAPELSRPLCVADAGQGSCELETPEAFAARVEQELRESRAVLEAVAGAAVTALAWPWGAFSPASVEAAKAAGLDLLFTCERGSARPGVDPGRIPRLEVRGNKPLSWFAGRMAVYTRNLVSRLYTGMRL